MKILTITFHRSKNYGAALQAYALQRALVECGYDTAVVDYSRVINLKKNRTLIGKFKLLVIKLLDVLHRGERKRFAARFEQFVKNRITLTKNYDNYESLEVAPPEADMYLIGSDQVWNITYRYRPEFFADFAPSGVKVASYAASIARYNYTEEQMAHFAQGMKGIAPVSVREKSGKKFLKEKLGIESEVHLDPVFLLDAEKWRKISKAPNIKEKYILCYALTASKKMEMAAKKIKQLTGCKIVSICASSHSFLSGDINVFDAGPEEFIGYIDNADMVLTTSFHGTAFSVVFEKTFYNFTSDYYASRTADLLKELSLTDRICENVDLVSCDPIDYSIARKIKNQKISLAYRYLESLKEVGNAK